MKSLEKCLNLLKRLSLSPDGEAVLAAAAECDKHLKERPNREPVLEPATKSQRRENLRKLVSGYLDEPIETLNVDVVRKIDERSRLSVLPNHVENTVPECLWLLARIVEHFLSEDARPYCAFCYRTVAVRSNGRLKEFCPEHASGSKGNAGGYLRGRAHQEAFKKDLAHQLHPDELALKLLRHQFNARRKGGGDAGYIVAGTAGRNWSFGSGLDIGELKLTQIAQGHPDWTELALRWRQDFEDWEGVAQISKGAVAITPKLLVKQWLRWKAWMVAGDHGAQVGKGRPAKFDHDEALRLRAEGMRVSEIAKKFPQVNPKSLIVFFSRWDLAHIDRDRALQLRHEGKTNEEIATIFGVSARSVTKVLPSDKDGSD